MLSEREFNDLVVDLSDKSRRVGESFGSGAYDPKRSRLADDVVELIERIKTAYREALTGPSSPLDQHD